ncbi:MAG: hypothetical protein KDC74_12035 [Flavobacteriaceae bacterium]|nr:hypothetical protein [Flavobacteriaceae bacterium]
MKRTVLFLVAILSLSIPTAVFATTKSDVSTNTRYYGYGDSFTFTEHGITFAVYPNGEFDFYLNPRTGIHANVNLGNVNISYNSGYDYDAYVQYDEYGAIIQIEDIPIYYDYYGRINRAGSVRIYYNNNRVVRVGGLHVYYDRFGHYTHCTGYINIYNRHYVYHPYHNYFVRPFYYNTIVSYKPYRKYYNPYRYSYKDYRNGYRKNNNYRTNRTFKSIDSRIRTADTNKNYDRRSSNQQNATTSRSSRNTTVNRNATVQRNTERVQRNSSATNTRRFAENSNGKNSSVEKRNVETRRTQVGNVRTDKTMQRPTSTTKIESRKAPQRSVKSNSSINRRSESPSSKRGIEKQSTNGKRRS